MPVPYWHHQAVETTPVWPGENRFYDLMRRHKSSITIEPCFEKIYGVNTPIAPGEANNTWSSFKPFPAESIAATVAKSG